MIKLPPEYMSRMKHILGKEYDEYIASLEKEPIRALRVNTEKISLSEFNAIKEIQTEKIPYTENGYYFNMEKIGSTPWHHSGMIYVQEPGAMMPLECVDMEKGSVCLDMCSAPGGKAGQIKEKIGEDGILVANEIIPSRCKILTGNIERMGYKNTIVTCTTSDKIADIFEGCFDYIAVDAPCSGEGMFRKDEGAIDNWSEENVKKCAERQREILNNAEKALKPGGTIIYSTCTFSLEENEKTVADFLNNHDDFVILPANQRVKSSTSDGIRYEGCTIKNIEECRRFYPHKSKGEGQFAVVLKHTGKKQNYQNTKKNVLSKTNNKVLFDFLDDTLTNYNKNEVFMYKDVPVIIKEGFQLPERVAFSCGVTIGEIKNSYILPHHQFFSALGRQFKRKIELTSNSEQAKKYLRGETIPTECENGWAAVIFDGVPVGGAKVVNKIAKNHYPKGLRSN